MTADNIDHAFALNDCAPLGKLLSIYPVDDGLREIILH